MWRPKDWKNPYSKAKEYPPGMIAIDEAMSECFEEGADAILVSLMKSGEAKTRQGIKGFSVFIPYVE